MEPIEIIYNGYIDGREGIDTAETNEAVGSLMGMIGSLLPNSGRTSFARSACTLRGFSGNRGS